ncbi:VOC family protein [Rhizorhabdus wittichii]|uniref:VOC family protein n=1 Tax=Rhizorhabdus wittichii TaxID=160791 RepID=A0A975HGY1_9SPHN|nr:VOC family protein [Rhizorhabdus wittichii]QTH23429.1 VOC family protein [Rhizorhabdus wittichii]
MSDPSAYTAPFPPRRIGHVNLWVKNLERSERFYNKVLGLNVEFTEPGIGASFLGTGHTPHDVGIIETSNGHDRLSRDGRVQIPKSAGLHPGLNHLAWEMHSEHELVESYRQMVAAGLPVRATADHQIAHSVYLIDPDGNSNELYADTMEDWRSTCTGAMDLITSAWNPLEAPAEKRSLIDLAPRLNPSDIGVLQPWRLTHAVLRTPQIDAMEAFYTKVIGLRVVERASEDGKTVLHLAAGVDAYPYNLVLVEADSPSLSHYAFQARNGAAFDASLEAANAEEIELDRVEEGSAKRALFIRDPDGLLIEYYLAA